MCVSRERMVVAVAGTTAEEHQWGAAAAATPTETTSNRRIFPIPDSTRHSAASRGTLHPHSLFPCLPLLILWLTSNPLSRVSESWLLTLVSSSWSPGNRIRISSRFSVRNRRSLHSGCTWNGGYGYRIEIWALFRRMCGPVRSIAISWVWSVLHPISEETRRAMEFPIGSLDVDDSILLKKSPDFESNQIPLTCSTRLKAFNNFEALSLHFWCLVNLDVKMNI